MTDKCDDPYVRANPTGKMPIDVSKIGKGVTSSGGPIR